MERILVLRGGALGDLIVTFPALQLLRKQWPAARIQLVGNTRAAELALMAGLVDAAHSQHEARWARLYADTPLDRDLQAWLDGFDLIVSYWPDPGGDLARRFAPRGAGFIASHAHVNTRPAAAHFCTALAPHRLGTGDYAFRLTFPPAIVEEAENRLAGLKHFLAIHPGSGSARKNWPSARWSELAAHSARPILAVTGEAEGSLPVWPPSATVRHAHKWPLPVLGAALSRCAIFVGHDSGVSHLAAAAGARCVLIFGPTDPEIWAPPGARVIRRGSDPGTIAVDDVLEALTRP
jgi:ADP-heptose:LPS heptosyltransferase